MDFPHLDRELCRNMAATILTSALASAALRWDALDRRAAVSAALSPALPALLASPVQPAAAVQNSVPVFGSRGLRDSLESPDEEAYKRRYEAVKPDLSGVVLPSSFTGARLIAKHQATLGRPIRHEPVEFLQFCNFGDKGRTTLLGRLNRMRLQPILPDTLGIGERCLHRHDPPSAHFDRLFDDKISARLFDRGKHQPQIGRIGLR